MRAIILSVGSEILRGDIVDTNAAFLARRLSELGITVAGVEQVGDDLGDLTAAIGTALERAQLILTTGGLGPTADDLTREAIAATLGEEPFIDDALVAEIEARFNSLRRRMIASNRKQAVLIQPARAIPNPNGTAPGWFVRQNDSTIVAMPGPPREMQPMWIDRVEPELRATIPGGRATVALMTFGLGESLVEQQIEDVIAWRPDITVATYAESAGVEVHVTARAATTAEAERLRDEAERMLRERLGDNIFGVGGETLSEAVAHALEGSGLTVATMESATGGLLSDLITNNAGSSSYFLGGVVAYTRPVKERYGVDPAIIDACGMVSAETAQAMADAIRRVLGADIGVSTTGIAGTEPVEGKPPGTCFVAVSMDGVREGREIHRPAERDIAKSFFAQCALDLLRRRLLRMRAAAGSDV